MAKCPPDRSELPEFHAGFSMKAIVALSAILVLLWADMLLGILSGDNLLLGVILVIVASYVFWKVRPRTVTLDNCSVRVTERLPFVSDWEKPVSAFTCVRFRTLTAGGEAKFAWSYRVELVYRDPNPLKTVVLHQTRNEKYARQIWMDAARVTGLPNNEYSPA